MHLVRTHHEIVRASLNFVSARSEWRSVENKRATPDFRLAEFGVALRSHDERALVASIEIRRLTASSKTILEKGVVLCRDSSSRLFLNACGKHSHL